MPENKGMYQKYFVERVDGKPIIGPTFTMELGRDPFALPALKAYRAAAAEDGNFPFLVDGLDNQITVLEGTGRPDLTG